MHLATTCYQLSYFDSQVQKLPAKKAAAAQRDGLIGQSQAIVASLVSYPADRCLGRRTGVGQMAGLARSSRPLV